jgi:Flp pilus assembly protein TadG
VTAVQFAFVAPVFIWLVLGLIEVGRGLMVTHELNAAARDGCRVAVLQGKSDTDVQSAVTSSLGNQGLTGYSTTVKVNDVVANCNTASSNDEISVYVSIPVTNVSWLPGIHYLMGSLTGRFSLRKE